MAKALGIPGRHKELRFSWSRTGLFANPKVVEPPVSEAVYSRKELPSSDLRVQNLLRSGAMRESQKPIWYDVYEAFPPLREPIYRNTRPLVGKTTDTVPPILYPEDQIRAKFYEVYGTGSGMFELARSNYKSPCQRFVEKYNELKKKQGEMDEDLLFAETGKALLAEGLVLSRKGKKVAPMPPSTVPVLELQEILQQEEVSTENPEPKTEPSEKPKEESS